MVCRFTNDLSWYWYILLIESKIYGGEVGILFDGRIKDSKDDLKRNDLINKEKKEIEIINQFLPKQLNRDEIKTIIEKFTSDNKISSIKDMGKIMEHLKSIHSGSIDIGVAANIAKELLNN